MCIAQKFGRCVLVLLAVLILNACAEKPSAPQRELTRVSFNDLPGWTNDNVAEALPALLRSCAVKPDIKGYAAVCAKAERIPAHDANAARAFFENEWDVFAVSDNGNADGLFTGYYEPALRGSLQRQGAFQTPLYARPDDLIAVDLGAFKQELKGQHIVGKVDGHNLKPYDDRALIARGSLTKRATVLAYVDDPVDAFFLAVQGSGRVALPDGGVLRIGYDGANGRTYVAIGRAMADKGLIDKPVTMQKIRDWLKAHPDQRDDILNLNPSYVFFKRIDGDGPIGAQGVALTPQRSMAVDRGFMALGTPLWVDTVDGNNAPLQHLVIAQDTGGAIKGVVRGDFFWGAGPDAAAQAGAMQSKGRFYILMPKNTAHDE